MSYDETEPKTLTIIGQCTGIMEKPSGWTEFQISVPGKNYPVKLATKLPKLIEEGRAVRDAIATWTYKESESGMNPRSGKPYKNRYLESVELGAATQVQSSSDAPTIVQPEPHHEPIHFADKERLITRQTCLKAAANFPLEEEGGDWAEKVMKSAERFEQWLYRDIDVEAKGDAKKQKGDASTASGNVTASGLPIPKSWDDIRTMLMEYPDEGQTWEMFERFGASARKLLFGDEGLNSEQKQELWQLSVRAAIALREGVDAAMFPPPSQDDLTKAWASVLDGQELQPVAKKEVPDAP